jgi:P27 family predicted phage terminase small subunit
VPAIRKPTELKVLEGRRVEGNPPRLAPLDEWRVPSTLRRRGRELWKRIVDGYRGTQVLQTVDRAALEALCMEWDTFHAAMDDVRKRGPVVESARGDGDRVRNPAVMVANSALERWHRLGAAFGLTPADRSRLDAPKVEEETDPLTEIINAAKESRQRIRARQKP